MNVQAPSRRPREVPWGASRFFALLFLLFRVTHATVRRL